MKFICIIMFLTFIACNQHASNNSTKDYSAIKFATDTISFSQVPIGDSFVANYKYSNIGDKIVHIRNVGSSCGCTVGKYDTTDLRPGESGNIKVIYKNSGDSSGIFRVLIVESDADKKLYPIYLVGEKQK